MVKKKHQRLRKKKVPKLLENLFGTSIRKKETKNDSCEVGSGRKIWKECHPLLIELSLRDG